MFRKDGSRKRRIISSVVLIKYSEFIKYESYSGAVNPPLFLYRRTKFGMRQYVFRARR